MDRLRYKNGWLAYVEAGIGSPAIMLVHDSAADHRSLLPLFSLLSARHRTVGIDLPGQGESVGDRTDPANLTDPAESTIDSRPAAIHWLRRQLGLGRVVLIGDGAGALVTTQAAESEPRRVQALIRIGRPVSDEPPAVPPTVPCLDLSLPATSTMPVHQSSAFHLEDSAVVDRIGRAIEQFLTELRTQRIKGEAQ